jgi:thiazole synthase ThiGH ThiG subunit
MAHPLEESRSMQEEATLKARPARVAQSTDRVHHTTCAVIIILGVPLGENYGLINNYNLKF